MATQITATFPALNFPKEVDYPTQEDWAAFSAAAELNFGILGGSWSTQMQLWKTEANAMSTELNTNATIAQGLANYQGDWTSKGYTLGQTVSVSGVYYICKLTHATGQDPTSGGSTYWNLAIGNWSLKADKTEVALKVALADFTGANASLANTGYQKLPSGLIIQWGQGALVNDSTETIIFPIAFPNGVFSYSATLGSVIDGIHSYSIGFGASALPKTAATITITTTTGYSIIGFNWIAIGY